MLIMSVACSQQVLWWKKGHHIKLKKGKFPELLLTCFFNDFDFKFFFQNTNFFSHNKCKHIQNSTSLKNLSLFCPNNHTGTVLKIHTTKFGRLGIEGLVILAYPFLSITSKDSKKVKKDVLVKNWQKCYNIMIFKKFCQKKVLKQLF